MTETFGFDEEENGRIVRIDTAEVDAETVINGLVNSGYDPEHLERAASQITDGTTDTERYVRQKGRLPRGHAAGKSKGRVNE